MQNRFFCSAFFYSLCFYLNVFFVGDLYCDCRQSSKDLSHLLQDAKDTQMRLVGFLKKLSLRYNGSAVSDPGLKQMKTIEQLLKTRWNGDASMITDYARATICVQNIRDVYVCLDDIKSLPITIVSVIDHFREPTKEMYRDINIVFRDSENDHLGEIQINTKDILEYKDSSGHKLFDEIRNLKANAHCEKRELTLQEIAKIEYLTDQSVSGYNSAYASSLKVGEKELRIGVYGVLIKGDQILMVKTQSGNKAIYNFPGGGVDNNEGFLCALKRECEEEINKRVEVGELFYVTKNLYMHEDFITNYMFNLYYKISLPDCDSEIENGKWFNLCDLPVNEMLPIDKEFIDYLKGKLELKK